MSDLSPSSATVEAPIFLVGSERSGTTLLRLMLNAHPQVTWLNEFEYAVGMVSDTGELPALQAYYSWLDTHRVFRMSKMTIDRRLSYPELVNSFLQQRLDTFNKPLVGATVHHHFDRLLTLWPQAKFIHIVRDPRAVSRSCVVKGWAGNVWVGLNRWIAAERLWDKLSPQLAAENKLEIRYQDLVANNRPVLEQVCQFVGVEYSEQMMEYVHTTDYGLPNPKLIQNWKTKLTKREIQLIEARVGAKLRERGFTLSGYAPIKLAALDKFYLKIQNWWARIVFRVRRYGLGLVIGDFVTRRIGARQLHRHYQLKMNEIQLKQLKKSW
ncbi:MAG: sulfotransferase [Phormidesmis sp.]